MSEANFYVYVDPLPAALPISVTVVYFKQQPPYVSVYETKKNFDVIDKLYDDGLFKFEHEWVLPRTVNKLGYRTACRHVLDRILPQLCLQARVLPTKVLAPPGTPLSFHYPSDYVASYKVKESNIAKLIGVSLKKELVDNIWHPHYPLYGWKNNLGKLDRVHTLACLKHGVNLSHHMIEGLKRVPSQWIRLIKQGNNECRWGEDYSREVPYWWYKLFGTKNFFEFMTPADQKLAAEIVDYAIPHPIYSFYKPLPIDVISSR